MRKKILFLDRDGVLLVEPKSDFQIDSFEKFEFVPLCITSLSKIVQKTDYELVMVTNQDGLGTKSFPREKFDPLQNILIKTLKNEGINFKNIHIDCSMPEEKSPNRKPGIGMLKEYFDENKYDLKNSIVIGDRVTDIELAINLGCSAIFFNEEIKLENKYNETVKLQSQDWERVENFLINKNSRKSNILRKTNETEIEVEINLDGEGKSDINTGIGFFDHMLEQLSKHSGVDIKIKCKGDLNIDEHHTIEDVGISLGEAFKKAIGNKIGINRYGFLLPMDDCLAQVAIDFSGRAWLVWDVEFKREKIGDFPTEMFFHFFKSFSDNSLCNLNIKAEGSNEHHKIEAIFKAVAKSIKMAIEERGGGLMSTKGVL